MANKKNETRTSIDELNDSLSSIEQHVENNKKIVTWSVVGVLAIAAIIVGYIYGIKNPNAQKASDAIAKADMELAAGQDSLALAKYVEVAGEYSNASGNRAAIEAAILLYKQGKYEEAIKYIDDFSTSSEILAPSAASLKGDCLVNLQTYEEAVKAYDKAISLADGNAIYAPVFMMKKATVLRELKNFAEEAKVYETIKKDYPEFTNSYRIDIDKYIERAKNS